MSLTASCDEGPATGHTSFFPRPNKHNGGWRVSDLQKDDSEQACPRVNFHFVDVLTGEQVPARCKFYGCEVCGPWRLREWQWLLAYGGPERMIVLTGLPPEPERIRGQLREFAYRLRQDGFHLDWAWSVEKNPKGTGFHAHVLQHGDFIPHSVLRATWGNRWCRIEKLRGLDRSAAYVLKESLQEMAAAGYSLKEALAPTRPFHRPVHLSRGFMRGETVTQARKSVHEMRWGTQEREWVKRAGRLDA